MPFQENPAALTAAQAGKHGFEVIQDLIGDHKRLCDHPPQAQVVQVLQLDNSPDFRNLYEVTD